MKEPEPDAISHPEAFAKANARARLEHLRSLTLEQAAAELEALLELEAELGRERRVPPLPKTSIAILLTGAPHKDDEPRRDS